MVSLIGAQRAGPPSTSSLRISSAPGVPPGSRVVTTASPASSRRAARRASWVDLPAPSPPSKVISRPASVMRGGATGALCHAHDGPQIR